MYYSTLILNVQPFKRLSGLKGSIRPFSKCPAFNAKCSFCSPLFFRNAVSNPGTEGADGVRRRRSHYILDFAAPDRKLNRQFDVQFYAERAEHRLRLDASAWLVPL